MPVKPFTPHLMNTLRGLMRDTVASGVARAANVAGLPVFGQVGSAPIHAGRRTWAHWFVGFRGDIAFAVLTLGSKAHATAARVAAQFLRASPR